MWLREPEVYAYPGLSLRVLLVGLALLTACQAAPSGQAEPREQPRLGGVALPFARGGRSEDLLCAFAPRKEGGVPEWLEATAQACSCGNATPTCRLVEVRKDRRRALLVRPGEALKTALRATPDASLRFAVAVLGEAPTNLDVRVRATEWLTGRELEWRRSLIRIQGWVEGRLDLAELGGRDFMVTAEVLPAPGAPPGAALALAAPRLIEPVSSPPGGPPSNVIVYLMDTLRPDRTSAYGYARPTTPRLAEVASSGVTFENAYTVAGWTRPATASLLTSLYPAFHGVHTSSALPLEVVTLAERFRAAGWSTWAFVTNVQIDAPDLNFEQGFDRFLVMRSKQRNRLAWTEELNAGLLPHLEAFGDEPFLLYVHAVDPHAPYDPPADHRGRFVDPAYDGSIRPKDTYRRILRGRTLSDADVARVADLYDEDVRYQDEMLGVLLDWLAARGLDERTVLVLLSDHGEELHDHGDWEHGGHLFEELIRIPLVIRVPGADGLAGRRVREPVQIVDVMPTLLRWYGLDGADTCQGANLTPLLDGAPRARRGRVYCEEIRPDLDHDLFSITDGRWKIIREKTHAGASREMLFDTVRDPAERRDLAASRPRRLAAMQRLLEAYPRRLAARSAKLAPGGPPQLDEETRQQLEALGYLERQEQPEGTGEGLH